MQNIGTQIKASEAVIGQVIDTAGWGRIAIEATETTEGVTEMTDGVRRCLIPAEATVTVKGYFNP
jgi:hypothetical protein